MVAGTGQFGVTVLVVVLLAWCLGLVRHLPHVEDEDIGWALWGGSLSAWLVTVVVGAVNTTLHHEHGLLVALLLGAWLAYRRRKQRTHDTALPE